MLSNMGWWLFILAPLLLGGILLALFPSTRRIRPRSLIIYLLVMSVLIYGALRLVAHMAGGRVPATETIVVLWFAIGWRLAWEVWSRTIGRLGQRWVRWARMRRRRHQSYPGVIRLIPPARALCTLLVFAPLFLCTVVTHRCKIADAEDPQSVFSIPFQSVLIPTSDGLTLAGWFIPDRTADRTIIICHGAGANKGNFIWFLGPLAGKGYNILFFDFRAHGSSDGRQATYGIRERLDVRACVDWLKRERPAQSRIIVGLGSSQGALALALAAAEDPRIDAVILDSPFVSLSELMRHHAGRIPVIGPAFVRLVLWEASLLTRSDFLRTSAEEAVSRLGNRPVLVIHGDEDWLMPTEHARRLHEAARGPKLLWLGPGPHSNIVTTAPEAYGDHVLGFLQAQLKPTSTAPHP